MLTLADVRRLALALPDATEAPHFKYTSFRVRGKIFATAPPDGTALHVFVGEEVRAQALALHPAAVEKLEWGGKVVGLRVLLARADAALVGGLLRQAWTCKAPKTLSKPAPAAKPATPRRKR
jgi:hypothetical protein